MTSRRSQDDHPSPSKRSAHREAARCGSSTSGAGVPSAPVATLSPKTETLSPGLDDQVATTEGPGAAYESFGGLSAPAGFGQNTYSSTGNSPRQSLGQPQAAGRASGVVSISDLLSEEPNPRRRPAGILTSGQNPRQRSYGSAIPSSGSASSSPTSARTQPSSGRRGFFDPARDLENEDVSMTDAPALTSPYQTSFPAVRSTGYPPALPAQGSPTGYGQTAASGTFTAENRYHLVILQQPIAARACGHGERDRRVVDPPPILQLRLDKYDPRNPEDVAKIRSNFNIVQCLLYNAPGGGAGRRTSVAGVPGTEASDTGARRPTHGLMGALATSPFVGTDPAAPASADPNARLGAFYIFHDLSCRQPGRYRLHFSLTAVGPNLASPVPGGSHSRILAGAVSDVFEVFGAKDFPGMRPSSALTRELKRQGATVSVKKGSEGRNAQRQGRGSVSGAPAEEAASASGSDDGGTMPPPPKPSTGGRGRGS